MKYFITRDLNEYGPYTLADLQRYVASGNILPADLTRSEGMTEWVPVSQVIGSIPAPAPEPVAVAQPTRAVVDFPSPPALHWAIVLALAVVTCGLFLWAWAIVQSSFVKRVHSQSKSIFVYIAAFALLLGSGFVEVLSAEIKPFTPFLNLVGFVLIIVANFMLRSELQDHYSYEEPIGLSLSGIMTFFFATYYFQYHLYRIAQLKKERQLSAVPLTEY